MFLSIHEMELGKVRFDDTLPPGTLEFFDHQLRQATALEAHGTAELLPATMEIRVQGRLKVGIEAECDRCLETVKFPLENAFTLTYRPDLTVAPHEEIEIHGEEAEIGFYRGSGLELADVLREQILLSLPMQRICREDCRGICPVCGQNRNVTACDCHEAPADDRWSPLRNL